MKQSKIIFLLVAILVSFKAYAAPTAQQLMGAGMPSQQAVLVADVYTNGAEVANNASIKASNALGSAAINMLKVDASDNTVLNSSAADQLVFQLDDDVNRIISSSAASDTALITTFGDTTDAQTWTISSASLDTDDNDILVLAGGGAFASDGSRGASITINGEDVASIGGDIVYTAGASDIHSFFAGSTQTMLVSGTGLVTAAAGFTATTADIISTAGNVILSAQDQQVQVLSGVASVDADVITASSDTSTVGYFGANTTASKLTFVANVADAVGTDIRGLKTRAAADAWNANTIISSGDDILSITAFGADGAEYINAAQILLESGGTPGLTTDMPGAIKFLTVPDGSGTLTLALTIEPDQDLLMTGDLYLADGQNLGFTAAAGANTACDTTCTTGCVAGWDTGTSIFVACTSALADTCLCTK